MLLRSSMQRLCAGISPRCWSERRHSSGLLLFLVRRSQKPSAVCAPKIVAQDTRKPSRIVRLIGHLMERELLGNPP